jgi:hypothetical protein
MQKLRLAYFGSLTASIYSKRSFRVGKCNCHSDMLFLFSGFWLQAAVLSALNFQFIRGKRTISGIIAGTTSAIWKTL